MAKQTISGNISLSQSKDYVNASERLINFACESKKHPVLQYFARIKEEKSIRQYWKNQKLSLI